MAVDFDETVERSDREDAPLCLVAVSEDEVVVKELPKAGELVIGRDGAADLQLPHPEVSRRHARVLVGPIQRIDDLDSANGTLLRGQRIEPGSPQLFEPGDAVIIGPFLLTLQNRRVGLARVAAEPRARARDGHHVFRSAAMQAVLDRIDKVARGQISVLLLGETGVGKEVLAEEVHRRSNRSAGPLIRVNCAAISPQLVESELFGHEKGAFTGAEGAKAGLLEAAHEGTLFLDEVGELPEAVQAKFLRVLEQREVTRVGSTRARKVDVRVVAATNRDLAQASKQGQFRQDLFFRLSGISIRIPPLRDRREEIMPLAESFAARFGLELGLAITRFSQEAAGWLQSHPWPGNVRELRNRVERAVLLQQDGVIEVEHLYDESEAAESTSSSVPVAAPSFAPPAPVGEQDAAWHRRREEILAAIAASGGNQTLAAERLGVNRKTLGRQLDKYQIPRPRKS